MSRVVPPAGGCYSQALLVRPQEVNCFWRARARLPEAAKIRSPFSLPTHACFFSISNRPHWDLSKQVACGR